MANPHCGHQGNLDGAKAAQNRGTEKNRVIGMDEWTDEKVAFCFSKWFGEFFANFSKMKNDDGLFKFEFLPVCKDWPDAQTKLRKNEDHSKNWKAQLAPQEFLPSLQKCPGICSVECAHMHGSDSDLQSPRVWL